MPLDGSDHSLRALEIAIQIAKKFGSKITLIHVYSVAVRPVMMSEPTAPTTIGVPVMTPEEVARVVEAARKSGKRVLEDGKRRVEANGVDVNTRLEEGHAVGEIMRLAKEGGYDLIVMGARGISRIREIILGSVSESVLHHATCPVLVVK